MTETYFAYVGFRLLPPYPVFKVMKIVEDGNGICRLTILDHFFGVNATTGYYAVMYRQDGTGDGGVVESPRFFPGGTVSLYWQRDADFRATEVEFMVEYRDATTGLCVRRTEPFLHELKPKVKHTI